MSKLPEDCPICGEKMDKGYVYHGGGIYWTEKKQRWFPEVERIAGELKEQFIEEIRERERLLK